MHLNSVLISTLALSGDLGAFQYLNLKTYNITSCLDFFFIIQYSVHSTQYSVLSTYLYTFMYGFNAWQLDGQTLQTAEQQNSRMAEWRRLHLPYSVRFVRFLTDPLCQVIFIFIVMWVVQGDQFLFIKEQTNTFNR